MRLLDEDTFGGQSRTDRKSKRKSAADSDNDFDEEDDDDDELDEIERAVRALNRKSAAEARRKKAKDGTMTHGPTFKTDSFVIVEGCFFLFLILFYII